MNQTGYHKTSSKIAQTIIQRLPKKSPENPQEKFKISMTLLELRHPDGLTFWILEALLAQQEGSKLKILCFDVPKLY